jgi:diguanylate cyclase (GGDEF)-like protein/PAS domain S-box-containing protein
VPPDPHLPVALLRARALARWLLRCTVLGFVCWAFGRLGFGLAGDGAGITSMWLPLGVALAGLGRWGSAAWPGVFAAFLALGLSPIGLPLAVAVAAGNTIGPLVVTAWWRRAGLDGRLERPRDLGLLLAGAAVAALLSGVNGALWVGYAGEPGGSDVPLAALVWPLGALVGALVAGVPFMTLQRRSFADAFAGGHAVETVALLAAALAAATIACVGPAPTAGALLFAPPVLLCALALRRGAAIASSGVLAITLVAAFATARGVGPFHATNPLHTLALLFGYVAALELLTLLAVALVGDAARRQERWRLAIEGSALGVADWDLKRGRGVLSRRWQELLDAADDADWAGWLAAVHDDDRSRLREGVDSLARRESFRQELRLSTRSGWRWFECQALVAERDAHRAPVRMVMTLADITERRGAEERQRLSASLFQHLHEGLLITDAELRVLDVNPTYSQITGLARADLLGRVPALLQPAPADTLARTQQAAMWASLRATGTWRGEMTDRRRNGDPCALHVTISAVRGPDAQARYHVLVISDITEQRLQRERLERQAHFDELTRLPNRTRMSQLLGESMAAAEREGYLLAVCYLDLDHFKPVNDRFGHAAGDRLLVELAQRLRGALRSSGNWSDIAARLGGDEFVLLLRAGTVDEARLAVERVLRVISLPYPIEAGSEAVQVSASVGATVYPLDRSDPDTLLRHADHAMYGAKQAGRNGYLFFDPEHSRRTEERVMAIGRVQEALDNHELTLHYQPKVDMRRGVVVGVEALLRWNHPEHGEIAPLQFLPLIEHTGLSARIGDWVLEQALDQLAHWQRMGLDLSVSVNVSARHLQEPDFGQRLAELLARQTRPLGNRLELEVLETTALADVAYTSSLLERCRRLGVRFALDDFGTGYSTLTYLKRLPVDVLKIDRSFVHSMLDDRQDLAIVEGVIGLARTFGCRVVAEGVESPAQARLLIEMGCDLGQGHGIASPMPATEVFRWVRDYRGPFAITAAPVPDPQAGETVEPLRVSAGVEPPTTI